MIPTQQVQDLFKPLLGQFAWNVDGGVGSMLTLEFGAPHILVREPRVPSPGGSERVRRHLRRRHVSVVGDWHLWIQYCDWKISVADGSCDSENFDWRRPDECLGDLDGQRLIGVGVGSLPNSWKFEFDLGGALGLWPPRPNTRLRTTCGASIAGAPILKTHVSWPPCRATVRLCSHSRSATPPDRRFP
jgi:hypothetical protein